MKTLLFWVSLMAFVLFASNVFAQTDNSEISPHSFFMQHLSELFTVGGVPHNYDQDRTVTVLVNHAYVVGYSEDRRNPLWSAYRASEKKDTLQKRSYERANFFFTDDRSTANVHGQTFGGGYDRGHMTPNHVISTQYGSLAQLETFYMTNMCPQQGDLNQGPWQRLEKFVTESAQEREHVFVIAGPIFGDDPEVVEFGPEREIEIPEAFYMILVDTDREWTTNPTIRILAYRFPQNIDRGADFKDRDLFGVSVDQLEEETHLDFFPDFETRFSNWADKEAEKEMVHW